MPTLRFIPGCACVALPLFVPLLLAAQTASSDARRDSLTRADSVARLAAVTVVATPVDRAAPGAATHVDAATIRLVPARSPYELLRQAAGVEVHEQGQGPGFASDASLRGFSSDHSTDLALWVDGVPINEPVNGHAEGYNDWAVLFPGGVQDIDVLRGPTSALFGNFSLAGTVNVRTLERLRGTELTLSGGSYGRAELMALTGIDHGADGGGVLGFRYQRENGFRPNAGYDVAQGHGRLVRDLRPGVTLDGGVELYGGNWNSPGFLSEDEFAQHAYDIVSNPTDGGYKRRAQERVSLRVLTGDMLWRTTAYATQGRWQLFLTIPPAGGIFEGSGSQSEEEDSRTGYGVTSALTWSRLNAAVTIGAESRWDRSSYESYFTTARARDSVATVVTGRQLSGALLVQSYADVSDRLRLDAGLRYDALGTRSAPDGGDVVSATHGVVSPKLGALVHLTSALGVYANVSRGFRSANGVISDPTLTPITAWAYETGLKLEADAASASAALFRTDVSDEQTLNPVTLVATNGGSSRRQGVELDWHVPLALSTTLSGDWTFTDARYRSLAAAPADGGGAPVVLDGLRVFNTASYVGAAALDLAPAAGSWRVRASGNWVGPYSPFDEPGTIIGGYGLMHLSGMVPVGGIELDAGVRNVFDRAYAELVAGHIVSPGSPRTAYVSARVRM
ncbi:MAG: TonB-dependent receptor [Gemmatimonadaceae bacterium]|nr:TonB-dependent receptor [Gemmatimonadaceae bacterium]NUS47062.1 TonB-dependent receptor [Gemmatimonadaceae bacterium]